MNRKIGFSLGIIVLLLGYIWFSGRTGSRDIPDLPDWEGDATQITIAAPAGKIDFVNEGGKWLINSEKFPGDAQRISGFEKRLRELQITDLISRQGYFQNYDLTPDKAVTLTVKQGDRVVRDVMIGKTASTGRHTYIRLGKGSEVYQVSGVFTGDTDGTVDDFRDKTVFKAEKDAVASFSVNYRGRKFAFTKEMVEEKKPEAETAEQKIEGAPTAPVKKARWSCAGYGNVELSTARIDGLLSTFNPLKASGFAPEAKDSLKGPQAVLTVNAYGKEIVLSIFGQKEDKKYLATSSESPYVFYLDEWKIKKYFIENLKDFQDNSR